MQVIIKLAQIAPAAGISMGARSPNQLLTGTSSSVPGSFLAGGMAATSFGGAMHCLPSRPMAAVPRSATLRVRQPRYDTGGAHSGNSVMGPSVPDAPRDEDALGLD